MSLYRRAAKRDASERAIVEALEACGFVVQPMSARNAPDLVCGKAGVTRVIEVKTGKGQLSKGQREWWARWKGGPVIVLRDPAEVPRLAKYWTLLDRNLTALLAEGSRREGSA